MKKFTRGIKGSISLFLSMVMLFLVILEGFLIDGSKVLAAKMSMAGAGELALNAGLTYYDQALLDIYGLFACSKTEEELTQNLEKHFKKTLGEAVGGADDGYVDQMLGFIKENLKNNWDGEEAGNLLNLTVQSFEAKGVENSQLSNPYVMKQEILQYMKYRGPASLGYGILDKLFAFKELDKQQETMEKKLDYEEDMSDVQKACEKAYEVLVKYNDLLDGAMKPESVEDVSLSINKNMREAILATWCYSALCRDYQVDKRWKKKNGSSEQNVEAARNGCQNLDQMALKAQYAKESLAGDFNDHPQGAMMTIQVMIGYHEEQNQYKELYTAWENYKKYYEEEVERLEKAIEEAEEDSEDGEGDGGASDLIKELEELQEEYAKYEGIYLEAEEKIDACLEIIEPAREQLEEDIDSRMKNAAGSIKQLKKDAKELNDLATESKKKLDNIIKKMDTLEQTGTAWNNAINNLSDGEIKTSMKLDHDNKAKELDRRKIETLQSKLDNGIAYAGMLTAAIENTKVMNVKVDGLEWQNYAKNLKKNLEESSHGNETLANSDLYYAAFDVNYWVENARNSSVYDDRLYTMYLINGEGKQVGENWSMDLSHYTGNMANISTKEDEFFKYLQKVCPKSEAEKEKKKDAEEAKKTLLEKGKSQSTTADEPVGSLPENITGAGGGGSQSFTETDTNADDSKVKENAKNNSNNSANFISGIGQLLEKGRDKLYLSEYAAEMFSCYTTGKGEDTNPVTLSNYPINKANNVMYKAEMEYIVWGNPNGQDDVNYTLATIFGIRFLLNSLYAFTGDPDIRTTSFSIATAIAGWTGFGVPLVQSVVILSFALAETSLDIVKLKNGESVPIYKSSSTWCITPKGITKNAIQTAIDTAKDAAVDLISEQLDNLTESTKDQFRNTLNDYTTNTIDNVVNAATSAVLSPIQERMVGLVNMITPTKENIEAEIDEAIATIENSFAAEEDSVLKTAKQKAVQIFKETGKGQLVNKIVGFQNQTGLTNGEITDQIKDFFDSIKKDMKQGLLGVVSPLVSELSGTVDEALDAGNEELQKRTSEALDNMASKINGKIANSSLPDTPSGEKGRTGAANALSMNYKEYVFLFIAVQSIANEEDMLRRIGNLIQANVACSKKEGASDFKITQAYTLLEVNASADLATTFFALPVPTAGGGSVQLGNDSYQIGYRSVLGY